MPDELYVRCLVCLEMDPEAPCSECGGVGFVRAGFTLDDVAALAQRAGEIGLSGISAFSPDPDDACDRVYDLGQS